MSFPYNIDTYINKDVIQCFNNSFSIPEDDSELIFNETKKWLWLCAKVRNDRLLGKFSYPMGLFIHQPLLILDEMWHSFLLFTEDYEYFCKQHLGVFIHHRPFGVDSKELTKDDITNQLSYIYDNLGEDTLVLWYKVFPERYSYEVIKSLRR
jgi:hypothetical protein